MKQVADFSDVRVKGICAYCGSFSETKEHVPPRAFLEKPFPQNLQTIYSCYKCNQKFSTLEEYASCLFTFLKPGGKLEGTRAERIFSNKPKIKDEMQNLASSKNVEEIFAEKSDVLEKIFKKLALGHLVYQNNESLHEAKFHVDFGLLEKMTTKVRENFEAQYLLEKAPEVGSRAMMQMMFIDNAPSTPWHTVQEEIYRYMTSTSDEMKIVIREFLWARVSVIH